MSDDILSLIPADPRWQPDQAAADRTGVLAAELVPGRPGSVLDVEVTWHDGVAFIDCGDSLEAIACPRCRGPLGFEWWQDRMSAAWDDGCRGFGDLAVDLPCCGARSSLDALEYDWLCGFARFEIAIWNPEIAGFGDAELAQLTDALGHPIRQIRKHI